MNTQQRRLFFSFLFLLGAGSFPVLLWLFPGPGSVGYAMPLFVLLWGGVFLLAVVFGLTTKPSNQGFRFEGAYYVAAFAALLALTIGGYSSGSEKPWREAKSAYFAWRHPGAITYTSLYDAYWGPDWAEPLYAAGIIKHRDALPEQACRFAYYRDGDAAREALAILRIELREGTYTTDSPTATVTRRGEDAVYFEDAVYLEDHPGDSVRVATEIDMTRLSAGLGNDELDLDVACLRPGPERLTSGFVSLFHSFLVATRWPWGGG